MTRRDELALGESGGGQSGEGGSANEHIHDDELQLDSF